jgi:hypothetical protein
LCLKREVLEAGVQHFFDAPEFGAPEVAHVVETLVDCVEALIDPREPCVEKRYNKRDQRGVEQHRDADRKIELFVGHQGLSALRSFLFSHERAMMKIPCLWCRFSIALLRVRASPLGKHTRR